MENCRAVIHVVDDDECLREAVARLLSVLGFEVRQYQSAGEFLLMWPTGEPGCVLLDVCMPGPSGLELQLALSKRADSLPVIFLTGNGSIPMSVLAIRRGAVDFLTKPFEREQLLGAITAALQRDAESSEQKRTRTEVRRRFDTLTPREKVVFSQVISGKLNKQIADTLGTCERTVKAHRAHVMEKMQVHSVAGLVHLSLELANGFNCVQTTEDRFLAEQAA